MARWQVRARRVRVPLQPDSSGVWWPSAGRAAAAGDESVGSVGRGRRSCEALCVGWFLAITSHFGIMPEESGSQVK